jgi:hypothetical protein
MISFDKARQLCIDEQILLVDALWRNVLVDAELNVHPN